MPSPTSRLTFGYLLIGDHSGLGDVFAPDTDNLKNTLNQIKGASDVSIKALHGRNKWHSTLNIRLEGPLGSLEKALDEIVEREGVPDFVFQPTSGIGLPLLGTVLARFRLSPDTPTTPDVYRHAQGIYREKKIRTCYSIDTGTLARSI